MELKSFLSKISTPNAAHKTRY